MCAPHYLRANTVGGDLRLDIQISIDPDLFSADVVTRTSHRYTGEFAVDVRRDSTRYVVVLRPLLGRTLPPDIEGRFRNDLLDDRLRERIQVQTQTLHDVLARAALNESLRLAVP